MHERAQLGEFVEQHLPEHRVTLDWGHKMGHEFQSESAERAATLGIGHEWHEGGGERGRSALCECVAEVGKRPVVAFPNGAELRERLRLRGGLGREGGEGSGLHAAGGGDEKFGGMHDGRAAWVGATIGDAKHVRSRAGGEPRVEFAWVAPSETRHGLGVVAGHEWQGNGGIVAGLGVERGIGVRLMTAGLIRRIEGEIHAEKIDRIATKMVRESERGADAAFGDGERGARHAAGGEPVMGDLRAGEEKCLRGG